MEKITPLRAIRKKCLSCSGDSIKEARLCPIEKCPLFPFRMGHKPKADKYIDQTTEQ